MSYGKTFWDKAQAATKESPEGLSTSQLAINVNAVRVYSRLRGDWARPMANTCLV